MPIPRCPECGSAFDAQALLESAYRRTSTLKTWISIYRHPVRFWADPKIRSGQFPALSHLLLILLGSIFLAGIVELGLRLAAHSPLAIGGLDVLYASAIGLGFLLPWMLIHGLLCWLSLRGSDNKRSGRNAEAIVCYSAAWVLWVLPAFIGSMGVFKLIQAGASGSWLYPTGIILTAALFIACVLWAISLYSGGMSKSSGNRWIGIWCVVCNPIWYIMVGQIRNALE